MKYEYGALELDLQGTTTLLRETPVPLPLCPVPVQHELACFQTGASTMIGWHLSTSAKAQPTASSLLRET